MKALSLWQPWATLIAVGAKQIETRSWAASYSVLGERIAIHAAKGGLSKQELVDVCTTEPFRSVLFDAGVRVGTGKRGRVEVRGLPLGAVVCTARLTRCSQITRQAAAELERQRPQEFAFGDYSEGRWAWILEDVQPLEPPAAARGGRGIFEWENELTLFDTAPMA
jgi:activating signal cointegrator 1